jgi:2-succinyl-5-enolpyruvyl-6-hydroxy-3-cyclohexene-1-carboxylate synthase
MNRDASTRENPDRSGPGRDGSGPPDEGMALAQAAIDLLLTLGVREVVICAGARNAALVAVLAQTGALRLWSFPEERSAAFFALGRVLALEAPVAVITTSGTAVAELLPAAIEAFHQGLPLVLVTADRPRAFRGSGAPQAIEQAGIFSTYVAVGGDVATLGELHAFATLLAAWDRRRPVQLNLCLEEPTAAGLARAQAAQAAPAEAPPGPRADAGPVNAFLADHAAGPLVAVVAALPARERLRVIALLQRLGCPVVAEATSGLRESPALARQLVRGGEAAMAGPPFGRVLRLGAVPSSRWWRDLEKRPDVRVLSLTPSGFRGLARPCGVTGFPEWDRVTPAPGASPPADLPAPEPGAALQASALAAHPRSEPALVHALSTRLPARSLVFLGNSLPIREWNAFATTADRGLRCHANRGANGIDGCVSTFLGLAADEPESWAVIGDLTALYDLAALWITPALPAARRRIVIINNGGGRIFARVAALRGLESGPRRLMENPHSLGFRAWAAMFGWEYALATTAQEIGSAAASRHTHVVIEVVPDPAETEAVWSSLSAEGARGEPGPETSGAELPMPGADPTTTTLMESTRTD